MGIKEKPTEISEFQWVSIEESSTSWCHQQENYYCISIDSQPFILFQIGNPTRFSTRLFFIVLLAIGMISSANIQIYYKFRSHFHTGITSIVLLSTSNTSSFSCVIIINLLHSNTLDSFNKAPTSRSNVPSLLSRL